MKLMNLQNIPPLSRHRRPVFKAKIRLYYETDDWVVYTANDMESLELVLRLRHEVFCEELQNRKLPDGIEKDHLDELCDHLIIWDKKGNRVVGTYRLFSSLFFKKFYSEEEFKIDALLKDSPEVKLELGRACIHRDYRKGVVIQLLWRGIALYMMATNARYLMGCSSLHTLEVDKMVRMSDWIHSKGAGLLVGAVIPRTPYRVSNPSLFERSGSDSPHRSEELSSDDVPSLVMAYHLAGAKFALEPAIDVDFHCADYFTYLDRQEMNRVFQRRYFREEALYG